ncbi:hypothetical protein P186_1781 [Pyrobaculum ferrireducens]|uniref:Uncharacterized protein n=1 Tax=Pyrobaculum ferrireducens TaxID=1104324 RepID=G7VH18_9CREN|nr:hypothetical protein P186_1781 [Pyrobaculum ferrireducens]
MVKPPGVFRERGGLIVPPLVGGVRPGGCVVSHQVYICGSV